MKNINSKAILLDPVDFIETFVWIYDKNKNLVPFILNNVQLDYEVNSSFRGEPFQGQRDLILKARQFGFTTLKLAEYFHNTITIPGTMTVIASHRTKTSQKILEKVKMMYEMLPAEIRPSVSYDNRNELYFDKLNSKIVITTQGKGIGRGDTIHNLLITELAFWTNAEDKLHGLTEAVPFYGNITIESTPNGLGNYFYKLVSDAQKGQSAYKLHTYMWYLNNEYKLDLNSSIIPDNVRIRKYKGKYVLDKKEIELYKKYNVSIEQLQWRRYKMLELGDLVIDKKTGIFRSIKFSQEYECDFIQSGRIWLEKEFIKRVTLSIKKDYSGRRLCSGVDTSEGLEGGDESALVTIDMDTGEEIDFIRGLYKVKDFSYRIHEYMKRYGGLIGIEVNNTGLAIIERVSDLWREEYEEFVNEDKISEIDYMLYRDSRRVGWFTSASSRTIMFVDAEELIREGFIKINSRDAILYNEIVTCAYDKNNVPKAPEGFTDHSLIALTIAIQMRKYYTKFFNMEHKLNESEVGMLII